MTTTTSTTTRSLDSSSSSTSCYAFHDAICRCGYSSEAASYLMAEGGFATMPDFAKFPQRELPNFLQDLRRRHAPVCLPFLANQNLCALRLWLAVRRGRGQSIDRPDLCTSAVLDRFACYQNWISDCQLAHEQDRHMIQPPRPLTRWSDWFDFQSELRGALLRRHRSLETGCPLAYVLRDTPEVDVAWWSAGHDGAVEEDDKEDATTTTANSVEDELMATLPLHGLQFEVDNRRVYQLLIPLVQGGDGQPYLRPHQQDGRGLYFALRRQVLDGTERRKEAAIDLLLRTEYSGQDRTLTLNDYTAAHLHAHNQLRFDCNQVLSEDLKVHWFLHGVKCDHLEAAKKIMAEGSGWTFDRVQQCLKQLDQKYDLQRQQHNNQHGNQNHPSPHRQKKPIVVQEEEESKTYDGKEPT